MSAYSVVASDTNTAATTQGYFVNGNSTPQRLGLFDALFGSSGTPGDQACEYQIRRITAEAMTPGGTAVTPFALDASSPASQANAVEGPTSEPTYATGAAFELGLNQRAPFRWVLHPGRELRVAASNDAGWGIITNAVTSAWTGHYTLVFEE